jgi:uncharacterized protein
MSDFDPAKEAINLAKHRISLARWVDLEVSPSSVTIGSTIANPRYRAYGLLDGLPHCLVFTIWDGGYRPISLRRAHAKELKRYAP